MRITRKIKRAAFAIGTAGIVSGAVLGGTMTAASASTIQTGWVQLCAQGNYTAEYYWSDGSGGGGVAPVRAGTCQWGPVNTNGQWVDLHVIGFYNTHPNVSFNVGDAWYNSSVSGIGLGAEGTTTSPWLQTW